MDASFKYQVFTPPHIVDLMLDLAGYKGDLRGKVFFESSFGRGDVLVAAVRRYIEGAIQGGSSANELGLHLEQDFFGFEIDEGLFEQCIERLDDVAHSFGISEVKWGLHCGDALFSDNVKSCHFAVGNPPYLEYKRISTEIRDCIKQHYECCRDGKFDYCYAFLEQAYGLLVDGGVLVQLVPGSVLKNVSAHSLRSRLCPGLANVVEFSSGKVFPDVMVAPAIIKAIKGANTHEFQYENSNAQTTKVINKVQLGKKWSFSHQSIGGNERFSLLAHAYMPIATLCNEAFIVGEDSGIEQKILKVAASPRKLKSGARELVIFPYKVQDDGSVARFEEVDLKREFPKAYAHLEQFESRLHSRAADKGAQWFEYGRSQSLKNLDKRRILISTVVTDNIRTYELTPGVVPYGGMVIVPKSEDSFDLVKSILESDDFARYAKNVGTRINGSSVRITSSDINGYPIPSGTGKRDDGTA